MRWVFVAVEFFSTCARSSDPQTETARKTVAAYTVDTSCGRGAATNATVRLRSRSTGIDAGINVGNQLRPNRLLKFHSTLASNALVRRYD